MAHRTVRVALAVIAGASLIATACTGTLRPTTSTSPETTPTLPSVNPYDAGQDPIVAVVERVAPAVTNVVTNTVNPDEILGGNPGRGVGSGFIIRSDGVVVTNWHVVEGASAITVTLPPPDERSFDARVIGGDSQHDLAVLKIEAEELPTVPLGDSASLALGQRVIAIGYALALEGGPTVTTGVISSLARTVDVEDPAAGITRTLEGVLQTDAAINPGNSGGPLVDLAGNVVGINTAGSGQAENIGFAIDIDAARPLIDQAVESPEDANAYLGVATETVTPTLAVQFDLSVEEGALVRGLAPDGPALEAGIEVGQVIVEFNGDAVPDRESLGALILEHEPGDEVEIVVVDPSGDQRTLMATLGVRPLPVEAP